VRVGTLLGHHWRRHRTALALLCLGIAVFEWIITRVAPSPEQASFLRSLLQMAPGPALQGLVAELTANLSARGFVAFGYVHPFPLLMMALWTVRVASGALAREIGQGTMDLIAARPVPRASQVAAALAAQLGGLGLIATAAWAGTAAGLLGRTIAETSATSFAPVALMAWLLFAAFGAVALLISAALKDGGPAIAVAAGLMAFSFAFDYLARAWRPIQGLRPLSLFRYYDPQAVVRAGLPGGDVAVLAAVTVAAAVAAFVVFGRRDL
jgi:ABC-2 type transport system permease protein